MTSTPPFKCEQCEWYRTGSGSSKSLHTCRPSCAVRLFVEGAGEFYCNSVLPCAKHSQPTTEPKSVVEAHNTVDDWCCACEYDIAKLNDLLHDERERERERIAKLCEEMIDEKVMNAEGLMDDETRAIKIRSIVFSALRDKLSTL